VGYEEDNFFVRAFWAHTDGELDNITRRPLAPFLTAIDPQGRSENIPITTNSYNLLSQYTFKVGTQHRVISGLNYRHNDVSGGLVEAFSTEDRVGTYVQDDWNLGKNFRLASGIRLDLHSNINPTYSPRVALFFTPTPGSYLPGIRFSGVSAPDVDRDQSGDFHRDDGSWATQYDYLARF